MRNRRKGNEEEDKNRRVKTEKINKLQREDKAKKENKIYKKRDKKQRKESYITKNINKETYSKIIKENKNSNKIRKARE